MQTWLTRTHVAATKTVHRQSTKCPLLPVNLGPTSQVSPQKKSFCLVTNCMWSTKNTLLFWKHFHTIMYKVFHNHQQAQPQPMLSKQLNGHEFFLAAQTNQSWENYGILAKGLDLWPDCPPGLFFATNGNHSWEGFSDRGRYASNKLMRSPLVFYMKENPWWDCEGSWFTYKMHVVYKKYSVQPYVLSYFVHWLTDSVKVHICSIGNYNDLTMYHFFFFFF